MSFPQPAADELFAALFSASPDAMAITRRSDGVYLAVNRAFTALTGYAADEVLGRSGVYDLGLWQRPEDRTRLLAALEHTAGVSPFDVTLRRKDGSLRETQFSAWPLTYLGEACVIGVARDVTAQVAAEQARRQAEAALQQAHDELEQRVRARTAELLAEVAQRQKAEEAVRAAAEQYTTILQTAIDGFWILDQEGRFLEVNEAGCRPYGYTRDEMLTMGVSDLEAVETQADTREHIQRVIQTGADRFETRHRCKDGRVIDVEISVNYLRRAAKFFVFLHDISERTSTQEQLGRSLERLHLATRAGGLGIWDWDIQKNKLIWDERMYALYGVRPQDFAGAYEAWLAGVHPEDRAAGDEISRQARLGERDYDTEFRVLWPDGTTRILKANGDVVRDASGQAVRMIGVNYDITERKQAEEEIRRLNAELEARVAARTAELSARTQELTKANAALRRAARLKDEFLSSMSHELRTPLTGILGLAEALQLGVYGTLTERQLKVLATVRENGEHLLELITDILDLSKLETGKLELHCAQVAVEAVCQASLRSINRLAQQKGLRVALAHDANVTLLHADARRLQQMLVHLLTNAVKFTPAGGKIGLAVEGDAAQREVRFVVWDTGIGITPENLPRLFQPFTQLDNHLARSYEGAGVGLSLVQRLAELHGGDVAAESEGILGRGSRFTITLPWSIEPP